jgi:hypothetical protein
MRSLLPAALLLACAGPGSRASAQDTKRCEPVRAFLTDTFGMVAEVGRDTIDDWRTHKVLPGCRVTAAGGAAFGMGEQATLLYRQLLSQGWKRTPEPRDAPDESALRLRQGDTDCFFTPYSGIAIGTEAERRVTQAYKRNGEDAPFNVLVQCVEAMDAAP